MRQAVRHLGRALAIARCLARHDALRFTGLLPLPLAARGALWLLLSVHGRRRPDLRDGQALAAALAELGPAFIKLGQVLSVRADLLGEVFADDLGHLRDRLPPFGADAARALVEDELKQPLARLFAEFDAEPVAAASVAQVHFARTPEGAAVAVKLLRPGVEAAFARDLDLFAWGAELAERHMPELVRLRPRDVVALLRQQVQIELDLRLEAAAAGELAEHFIDDADLVVPRIDWSRTSQRVLTLERLDGIRIEDRAALLAAGHDPAVLAPKVIQAFLRQALQNGYFHADMHHGNVFVLPDGRLGLVDFGIMGRISLRDRRFLAEMLGAFLTGDWKRAADVHFEAGYVPADRDRDLFAQACRAIGEPIRDRPMAEISIGRLLAQLFQVTETFGMPTQPHLLLLQKTMVTVEGVARGLDPAVNFWDAARPVVTGWAEANLGPDAVLRDLLAGAVAGLRRLPALLEQWEARLTQTAPVPVPEPAPPRLSSALAGLLALVAALLALNLL